MTKCYFEPYIMPAADMGELNPLPDIKNVSYIHAKIETTDAIPEELSKYINKGMISTMLPYCQQDGYNRKREDKAFKSVVIENEHLKAVFLPELGGRLWSLIDKNTNKDLLYCNPVFQPGNLALRNAWFSGGVEFNVSIKGHNPLTCDPLFAQKIVMPDGSEGVRMFEYERIRGVVYSIDAWIPEGSKYLYVRPKIENRTGKEIWMYWWSNIAVPIYEKMRVIAPAENTFINYFGNNHYMLDYASYPEVWGTDASYPENLGRSLDFFYHIPDEDDKWIAAVDKNGYGLIHCSSPELKGRKLFLWGEGAGGKNWNQYLSDGTNEGYIEIQAGLARTQLEHIPMQDGDTWSWTEAYGAVDIKSNAHKDWDTAISSIKYELNSDFPSGMSNTLGEAKTEKTLVKDYFMFGSGWGILEQYRREINGDTKLSDEISFPMGSLEDIQKEWLVLKNKGYLPERNTESEIKGYVIDEYWHDLLTESVKINVNRNWYALMHLGVMEYASGNTDRAFELFNESVKLKPNAWCYRNIAMIYRNEYSNYLKAYEYMTKAFELNKTCRGIVVDTAVTYLMAEKYDEWLEAYNSLGELKNDGRLKLYCAKALMNLDKYSEATEYLNKDLVMPDIKEGDTAISDEWFELYGKIILDQEPDTDINKLQQLVEEKYPLDKLDFRTH